MGPVPTHSPVWIPASSRAPMDPALAGLLGVIWAVGRVTRVTALIDDQIKKEMCDRCPKLKLVGQS